MPVEELARRWYGTELHARLLSEGVGRIAGMWYVPAWRACGGMESGSRLKLPFGPGVVPRYKYYHQCFLPEMISMEDFFVIWNPKNRYIRIWREGCLTGM